MTSNSNGSVIGAPPPSRRTPAGGANYFGDLLLDLAVRIEWLEQVLDSVPEPQASSGASAMLRGWAKALDELESAIVHFQEHLGDRRFARLFALGAPLAAYLGQLYSWCEEITIDFEALAVKLRRREPVLVLFPQKAVNDSFRRFQALSQPLRESFVQSRPTSSESQAAWSTFDSDLEELLWATEWMHMSLAKSPGT
jgi:hypothetical protein